jgi:hypothetical protein
VYYQGQSQPEERFSFFIMAEDDDGVENLRELSVYHDREGLRWNLTAEDWIVLEEEGKTWIGSRAIAMPEGETLPRGQYRAVLVNKGGEHSERTFSFDAPEGHRYAFPVFTIYEGWYSIESEYPRHFFIGYDREGKYIQTISAPALQGNITNAGLSGEVKSLSLWAEDPEYHTAALTGIHPVTGKNDG